MIVAANLLKAVAWMMGALLSFAAMSVSIRELSFTGMHAFEMLFLRSAVGVVILAGILSFQRWGQIRTGRVAGHLLRNVVHFAGQVFWIFGITLLPLATVSAFEFTTPVWGAMLAVLFLGERMNRGRWVAMGLGALGILIILRPGLGGGGENFAAGAAIMLACTFCFGATNAVTKWLTRSDGALTILFYMVLMQTVLGAFASAFVWIPVQLADWPLIAVLALTGLSAHYCLTRALAQADATLVMPMEFLRLPLIAVVGFLLYQESLEPAILLGAALIFSGTLYSLRFESRRPG